MTNDLKSEKENKESEEIQKHYSSSYLNNCSLPLQLLKHTPQANLSFAEIEN